ncbi:MAG: GNAT family N-acetyltransferase [Cyanobacteria bacterium HKST-UBA06]|nr:GNAT family N-acetyltransferase [Cyanobacteria bacterium HKST-UBA04]MCA9806335.1 GNAT family N-acetyltransferase [Cyanobacteria bacterium HKST-UBA06]MCA9840475.1 GNAT family N-acetyltransferase [Cyanobacteria bacterium HKST-UBA03]
MVKIRPIGPNDLKQVLALLETQPDEAFDYPGLGRFGPFYLPFHQISHWLPLKLTFLPGIFVAVEQKKVLGLVWISQDGANVARWKIDQLLLDPSRIAGIGPSALDVGRQLIDYVINTYGAKGVETFLAYVDNQYDQGLALLKECGFRHCARLQHYERAGAPSTAVTDLIETHSSHSLLREAKGFDRTKLSELYAETLPPEVRVSLRKTGADFFPGCCTKMLYQGFYKHWVLGEAEKVYLMGSVSIKSRDYRHFQMQVIVNPGWQDGLLALLAVALRHVYQTTREAVVTTNVFEFHGETAQALKLIGFEYNNTSQVLVRDYWSTSSRDSEAIRNPVLLFTNRGRTSPAFR